MSVLYIFNLKKAWPLLAALALIFACLLIPEREAEAFAPASSEVSAGVLVIDPGHGGEDGGASSAAGLLESRVNLDVALKLRALAGLCGVETVMTRDSQEIEYPPEALTTAKRKTADQRARVALISAYPGAVLISIHQNCFPDSRPSGAQVLYAATDGSRELGELAHANLCAALCPENRRVAIPAPENIFLMRSIDCTGILVECGFLSNPGEAALLADRDYQLKIASVLLASYLQFKAQATGM